MKELIVLLIVLLAGNVLLDIFLVAVVTLIVYLFRRKKVLVGFTIILFFVGVVLIHYDYFVLGSVVMFACLGITSWPVIKPYIKTLIEGL